MNSTDKKMPTGDSNPPAGRTDSAMVSNPAQRIKTALIRIASWLAVIFRGVA